MRSRPLWLRHMLWCEYIHTSSPHQDEEENTTPLPSLRDVLSIVAQLQEQVRGLEARLAACERTNPHLSRRNKGHAHITSWLNETWPAPSFPYSETHTLSSLSLTHDDILFLADKTFAACLERVLPRYKDMPGNPLVSLQWPWPPPKRPVLYWYDSGHDSNNGTWKEWTRDDMVIWLDKLQRTWLHSLCTWWKQSTVILPPESEEYEQRQQIYNKAMIHLMVSFKEDVSFHRAKHVLVAQLLRQVPETEVSF